ncbi:hypothetical protein [Nocardiopsis algeriensis]|uniref:Uncharacterized protein n=1 Tax=Nocardiopsis algeriensis TaxID=1478215 RepID=A0A841ILZ0_9ACTN|nr:hypothetical protein [Nocardiopsis algeriensis]MBB6119180.1 hypothetical protein [Nocardiopsis algeriensis]
MVAKVDLLLETFKNINGARAGAGVFFNKDDWVGRLPSDFLDLASKMGSGLVADGRFLILDVEGIFDHREYHQMTLGRIYGRKLIHFKNGRRVYRPGDLQDVDSVSFSNLTYWGGDDNGAMLFWDAVGSPGEWSIVATDFGARWIRYRMHSLDYLYGLFSRNIECPIFTQDSWPKFDGVKIEPASRYEKNP